MCKLTSHPHEGRELANMILPCRSFIPNKESVILKLAASHGGGGLANMIFCIVLDILGNF